MKFSNVIAIDGPSGSGKSTLAKRLASELNLLYIDTGSMYRALALRASEVSLSTLNPSETELENFLSKLSLNYLGSLKEKLIEIDGVDFTNKIRGHQVSELASNFSKLPQVRNYLTDVQRKLASQKIVVMEGRDIGTVVFPDAFCKIFLSASAEVRAKRRWLELKERGQEIDLNVVLKDIQDRDDKDINRPVAPLKQAQDAHNIDSSDKDQEQVLELMKSIVKQAANDKGIDILK
ncbi:MAG: (d)CMP kinase [Bacteriovoracaceae bacterium]